MMHTGRECSPIGLILRRSSFLFSALESFGQAQSRCPGSPHPQRVPSLGGINSVGRCPVAHVAARGRAVLGAGAVAVGLFASVRRASSSATRLVSVADWSLFSSASCFWSSTTCFLRMSVCSSFFSGSATSRTLRSLRVLWSTSLDHTSN